MVLLRSFIILLLFLSISPVKTSEVKASEIQLVTENYPPLNYLEQNELQGIGADIVGALQKKVGTPSAPKVFPWKRAYRTALSTPNTGIFSITRTKERENLFNWVGPLYSVRDYIFIRKSSDFSGQDISDLKALHSIGLQAEGAVHKALAKLSFHNLIPIHQVDKQLDLLISGRISALQVSDLTMSFDLQKSNLSFTEVRPIAVLNQADMYLAFSKDTPLEEVNKWQEALNELIKEGKHAAILGKHLPSLSLWSLETGIEVKVN
ncbi:substrate-binding periplasmic protein [Kiloniella majae]|uniref:substrate-binding periplasmic protein n=1 Tax=Kiloniella majae TaxID=1938558 RepID=UPI0013026D3F|nr:transporter substrate-binding domain-containing protein [Kiloniella majae]